MNEDNLNGENPSIDESIDFIFNGKFADLKTSMPAKIVTFDLDRQRATVQPLWKRVDMDDDGNEVIQDQAIINEVPVQYYRFGNWVITSALKPDDTIFLQFAERSLDSFLASDGKTIIDPIDGRMHNINDAYIVPCFSTDKNAIINMHSENFVLRSLDGNVEIHLTPNNKIKMKAVSLHLGDLEASKAVALAEPTNQRFEAIETYIQLPHGSPVGPTVPAPFTAPKPDTSSNTLYVKS